MSQGQLPPGSRMPGGVQQSQQIAQSSKPWKLMNRQSVEQLIKEIDPTLCLDADVIDLLMDLLDDFIEDVIDKSTDVAAARGDEFLRGSDVSFVLERFYNMWLPGMLHEAPQASSSLGPTEVHAQRMAAIKKTLKKQ